MRYRFDGFELDIDQLQFRSRGEIRLLEPQVFDILRLFVENHGRLITRDELVATIWGGRAVSESAVDARIHAARRAVDDDGRKQERIKTVTRRGYRFVPDVVIFEGADEAAPQPDKPSIAVLPFDNMSGEAKQEYFSDGIAEDIITELSRFSWLTVIAHNSAFAYKGRAVDLKQIGQELGTRYLLEGSVRKAGNRVRVTAQLIEAATGGHIWAERYDREITDIFALQDDLTQAITVAVAPQVESVELNRVRRRKTTDLDAWDLVMRARYEYRRFGVDQGARAIALLRQVIARDPDDVTALAHLSICLGRNFYRSAATAPVETLDEARRSAHRALELDRNNYEAMQGLGVVAMMSGDHDEAHRQLQRAVAINPNDFQARFMRGWALVFDGQYGAGITELETALTRNPDDPQAVAALAASSFAHLLAGRPADAVRVAEQALHELPAHGHALRVLAAAHGRNGDIERARYYAVRLLAGEPHYTIGRVAGLPYFSDRVDITPYIEGLRAAGLPD
ncbi:MAG: winged helix-turn-helix domain-containing protein [Alphaproteobacteria bacterium]|nr:winged helix-turn-helix domain-containing protein [Alphaproteobacteria bacterium]